MSGVSSIGSVSRFEVVEILRHHLENRCAGLVEPWLNRFVLAPVDRCAVEKHFIQFADQFLHLMDHPF